MYRTIRITLNTLLTRLSFLLMKDTNMLKKILYAFALIPLVWSPRRPTPGGYPITSGTTIRLTILIITMTFADREEVLFILAFVTRRTGKTR